MIPAVVTNPANGQPVVVAQLEKQRDSIEKEIRAACNEFLSEPDWNKNMEIVDTLNRLTYLCPFAIKEIRKQLKTKNPEIEILALGLVEGIIKNCPSSHAAIAQEDFMRYLVKVGKNTREGGKFTKLKKQMTFSKNTKINSAHVRSQCVEKALLILKMLAAAYEQSNQYPVFKATYTRLLKEGTKFPETNKDESLAVFASMHSSGAPNEFGGSSAMGSIPQSQRPNVNNSHLPMIRQFIPLKDITDSTLVAAQENSSVLYDMINIPSPAYDLIPELIAMLANQQQRVVILISDGNAPDKVIGEALQMNDICNQVMEDAQCILTQTKRPYQAEIKSEMKKLFKHNSDAENKEDNEHSLEESISLEANNDPNGDPALFALTAPTLSNKKSGKNKKRRSSQKSLDLLDMGNQNKTDDLMSDMNNGNDIQIPPKKESDDDIMGFLGLQSEPEQPKKVNNEQIIFDPLSDIPGPAPSNPNPPQQRQINQIQKGNNSVLDVLTNGEASHSLSANSTPSKSTPYKSTQSKSQNNKINNDPFSDMNDPFADMGGSDDLFTSPPPQKASPQPQQQQQRHSINATMIIHDDKPKPKAQQQPDNDPFADMNDPFADIGGGNDLFSGPPKKTIQQKPQSQPKPKPKAQTQQNNDLFTPMNQNQNTMNMGKKQDSNNIILDLFANGASPDPNQVQQYNTKPQPKPKPKTQQQKQEEDNTFDALSNPFDASGGNLQNGASGNADDNPFDALGDPFGAAGGDDDDNPFADMAATNNAQDFMGDRDPFADM